MIITRYVLLFVSFISTLHTSWYGPFKILNRTFLTTFNDMPFVVVCLIVGTINFVGNCEILKFATMKKSFDQHFPIFDKSRFLSVCVFIYPVVVSDDVSVSVMSCIKIIKYQLILF